ncbi:M20/M25/M40 family metallo-hydrolase [Phenylobacterium aquaticum]|uniref:M20/M25/M40 family metallo-hydrolase n=1 Tax=Phenylobacterium aquaticum TaxID=1763816 RepID=UPI001F5CDA05|nr:M20/M25/M40 family metallo-hydrolase [Phenylobacterium aquaticum]MCI3133776.1 M20/M25/M40 family metallo-hydrolase [Phenylobacterium aquaticum]
MTTRTLLLGGLSALLLAGAAQAAPAAKPAPLPPAANQALAHDILKELIAINTVHDHGTLVAAKAVLARLKTAGFSDADAQLLVMPEHPNQGQVVVRLRAKAPKAKPVLWIGHLDVVEAKPEDWTVPPFALTEKDGWWYGRGVQDMKGEDAIVLAALIRLKQEGFTPDRDLIFAFTSDEESGDANGVEWLVKTHRDLIDAGLVINPDGGGGATREGKPLYYGIQTSEKVFVTFQIEATNKGGHSSIPEPDNAIYELAKALDKIAAYSFPVETTPTTRGDFLVAAAQASGQTAADLKAVAQTPPDLAAAARLSATPERNARLRTTCVATGLSGGHAENALPQRASALIQCRMMPVDSQAQVQAKLAEVINDPKIAIKVYTPANPAPDSPLDPALNAKLSAVIHAEWPGVTIAPHMDLGASDSIYTRAVGIPSYAMAAVWYDADDNRAHGRDERISEKAYYEGLQFQYGLIKSLGGGK